MKIAIKQVKGNSGIDVWAQNLCNGIQQDGHHCTLDLKPSVFEFYPDLLSLFPQQQDVDIIHGNSWNGFAFKNSIPLVVTEHLVVHDPAFNPYRTLAQKIYHRWIYRCERKTLDAADAVTCVSNYSRKKLEDSFGCTNAHVIYNGIDTEFFEPKNPFKDIWNFPIEKNIIFFAGNLSRRKGGDLLPLIMQNLGDQYLLFLATGQRRTNFQSQKNIMNLGHLQPEYLVDAYNRCDIFLSASRLEGFGLSVAEAMACGKPVVATNGSSLPELVVEGKGGFLCEMDNVQEFAERIHYLSENPDEREKMGRFNRERVTEMFTIERMMRDYIGVYKSLL